MSNDVLFRGIKPDSIIDIYELFNGKKDALVLPGDTNPYQLYHEAYEEGKYITTTLNKHSNYLVVQLVDNPTLMIVANQLVSVLMYGENKFVTYKGLYKTSSLRAAAYKIASSLDIKINASLQLGMVYISIKRDKEKMADKLANIQEGETVRIPVSLFNTAAQFRSALQSYSYSTGFKFKTRVEGLTMVVTRVDLTKDGLSTLERIKWFVNQLQWDVPTPLNPRDFPKMKRETLRSNLYRLSGNTISCVDNIVVKRSKKLSKVKGDLCVIYKGDVLYSTPSSQFDISERTIINKVLEPYSLKFGDFSY